jgi:hypothetical protein
MDRLVPITEVQQQQTTRRLDADGLKVFVLGPARSGTSIMWLAMRRVLGLPGRGESHVMPAFARMLTTLDTYKKSLIRSENISVHQLQADLIRAKLSEAATLFYQQEFPKGSWVDKTPGVESLMCEKMIEGFFPQARIVIMYRNGIEVVKSFRSKFNVGFDSACVAWAHGMDAAGVAMSHAENAILVDQFDLTNSARATAEKICLHLNRPEKAAALEEFFGQQQEDRLSTHDWRLRLNLSDTDWSDKEKAHFRKVCGPNMERFGYEM